MADKPVTIASTIDVFVHRVVFMTSTWQFWRVLIPGVAGDTLDKFVKFEFSGDELVVTAPGAVSIGDAELSAFGQIKTQTWVGAT